MTAHTAIGRRAGRREWTGLAVLALPTLLLALDVSVLHLAAPHLSADLNPTSTQLLWILDIYGFMIAGFLVTMGTLGDRIGRRRLLLIGATAFGAASVVAAYSTSAEMLIATRALLGIAGATLMPSTLALISNMFSDARQRATAVGVWMMSFMSGVALGPVIGGMLLENFWWGSVFLLGVPVMLLLLVTAPFLLPEYRDAHAGRLDLVSVGLSLAAAIPVIYGMKELAKEGLEPLPVAALVAGAAFGLLFVRRQRTLTAPLLDLRLFTDRTFTSALTVMLVGVATSGGVMLLFIQYLQMVRGYSPIVAGLWMLPATGAMVLGSMFAPVLARRVPPGQLVAGGLVLTTLGYLALALAGGSGGFAFAVVGVSFGFLGLAPTMVLGTDLVLGSAPPAKAGSASSMSETAGELGMALGVALLGTVGASVYRARMGGVAPADVPDEAAALAEDSLPGALTVAGELPREVAAPLLESARDAFTSGMSLVALLAAAVAGALSGLALVTLRRVRPLGEAEGGSEQEPQPQPQPQSAVEVS
ncbi:MFS transporter [Streptomyces sp. CA-250714]|uniref:MFS transporter n=1 Tax=Streptomyces sp. CA-250714 TaxID=3240060 RepID=UPI003D90A994